MTITAQLVKDLRAKTGIGMMECKKALVASDGDMDKAILYLRERGMSRAAQKSSRTTSEGMLFTHSDSSQQQAVMLEINCETDFVSKNSDFNSFGQQLAALAITKHISSVEELTTATHDGRLVKDLLIDLVSKIGENITISKLQKISTEQGFVSSYIHLGGKLGTLVAFKTKEGANKDDYAELGRDVAMHVIASAPRYLQSSDVDATEVEQEKAIAHKKLTEEGKPDAIIPKIIAGQIKKFYDETCLLQQPYVKEPKVSVQSYLHKHAAGLQVAGFVRMQVGE
ncbi:MAG: translation elongation factor Ts [Pseudomonadota bacterium]|nr:translation elongation factor Ts [Pseudomonadota bacterium]